MKVFSSSVRLSGRRPPKKSPIKGARSDHIPSVVVTRVSALVMDQLKNILRDRPSFHRRETEVHRTFEADESVLPREAADRLLSTSLTCYGLDAEVLSFIADNLDAASRSLETGAGCSTLVFAIKGASHTAVTPSTSEIELIKEYGRQNDISLEKVRFVREPSERYLPQCDLEGLDLVLLDGKHAFPWPIVDWFFTADKLRNGGVMIVDDVQLRPVRMLVDFMRVDPGWELLHDFSGKTSVFKKIRESIHDVAWHMQPFGVASQDRWHNSSGVVGRLIRKLRKLGRH